MARTSSAITRRPVDTELHLIVTHKVTNSGSGRAQLANMAKQAKAVLKTETLEAVADPGYFNSPEILACHEASSQLRHPSRTRRAPSRMGASVSRTLSIFQRRTPIAVRPGSDTNEQDGKMLRHIPLNATM